MPIRGSPNGANALVHTIHTPGRHRPESVDAINRNGVDVINRNGWSSSRRTPNYPFKFLPTNLPAKLRYVPRNLNYDRELIEFQSRDRSTIQRQLREIFRAIDGRVLPWAKSLTVAGAKEQLTTLGENAWCERMWIEDCNNYRGA